MSPASSPTRARGRPRAFDEEKFLDTAIALFSNSGFSGVSLSTITSASGLTVGSVYKAYRDKEGVFARALERYIALREVEIADRFQGLPDARSKIAELLYYYLALSQGRDGRLGCMVVAGVTELDLVGEAAAALRHQLASRRQTLSWLVAEGQRDGSITDSIDQGATAELLLALLQGMRVVGKAGDLVQNNDAFVARALRLLD